MRRKAAAPEERYMREALRLARRGLGRTRPNPAVGAVLVKDGTIIGRGYHRICGGPHAEIEALTRATTNPRGADVYVTLEPCGHHGKTPPCAAALVEARVRRVFYGCPDPNPTTSGTGLRALKRAGIAVSEGPLAEEARHLNGPYLRWVTASIPLVTAKWAMTLDGKIATRKRHARWVTSEPARRISHQLRNEVDAIMVGTETVLHDDPELTCRLKGGRSPVRIVLDRRRRLPLNRRIFTTCEDGPVLLYTSRQGASKSQALRDRGVETVPVRVTKAGLSIRDILRDLGRRGIHHLLVEGGGALLGAFFDASLVNRAVVFVAPKVTGGETAVTPVGGRGVSLMDRSPAARVRRFKRVGPDYIFWADFGS